MSIEVIEKFHKNGQIKVRFTYINDQVHGLYQTWHEDGRPEQERQYEHGVLHGYERWWYHTFNQLHYELYHVNGVKQGLYQQWHLGGELEAQYMYVDGKIDESTHKRWYESGRLLVENQRINNDTILCQQWYENGKKSHEYTCKGQLMHGVYREWTHRGLLKTEKIYEDGKEISLKKLANRLCKKIKEDLMKAVCHPDRIERIAESYQIEPLEYLDIVC
jgi:antitoxin component YwqK of YwqJK toxin-antitoxin module